MTKTTKTPTTETTAAKLGRGKVPQSVAENVAKEAILHLRLERADHDALEALVLSTGLDRSALTRLVLRAGLRIAENDPRDLLAPGRARVTPAASATTARGSGSRAATGAVTRSATRSGGDGELAETGGVTHALHTAADGQVSVATPVANDTSKPRTKPTKG